MTKPSKTQPQAQGPFSDLALHTIGWKAFQDMAAQICEAKLGVPVTIFRESNDGGQDAVLLIPSKPAMGAKTGTAQVKHSSSASKTLAVSDLTPELENLKQLVKNGQAHSYIFITNMSVDAPVAKKMCQIITDHGVKEPQVWGKQQLILTIKSDPKLRALIPQVYGLGDLSVILDERAVAQTQALLEGWIPKLKCYVPTIAHQRAVHALDEHGAVLLLGNPSSGKSTIGAILTTMAAENENHTVIQVTSPSEFVQHWNPNDKGRFFWIDDAFGSNTVNPDYVQEWTVAFTKINAAMLGGNRFLFTSRRHIYQTAERRLGQRNLQLFTTGKAVVDVGDLTKTETTQILYNHLKFGNQTTEWKAEAKQYLQAVANVPNFLPGIAERLGNPDFTKKLKLEHDAMCSFMAEPREHLVGTLLELEDEQFAALAMIYVHRGQLNTATPDEGAKNAIIIATGVAYHDMVSRLKDMAGSFCKTSGKMTGVDQLWTFEHPTIADAMTEILGSKPHMVGALIRGAPVATILESFVCEDVEPITDAAIISTDLESVLTQRLETFEDGYRNNNVLFEFLARRASGVVIKETFTADPDILERSCFSYSQVWLHPKFKTAAKAHQLGCLSDTAREHITKELHDKAVDDFDLTFLDRPEMLDLFDSADLFKLSMKIYRSVSADLESMLEDVREKADFDDDVDSVFEHIDGGLRILEEIFEYEPDFEDVFSDARSMLETEKEIFTEEQTAYREETEKEADWDFHSEAKPESKLTVEDTSSSSARSVFVDLDQ